MIISGIYAILNIINNKVYVGSAKNFKYRWQIHISRLAKNKHHSEHLQAAWNKYGQNNFIFYVLKYVENLNDLLGCEQYWMDEFEVCNREKGYNVNLIAGSRLATKNTRKIIFTEERRKRISESKKGKPPTEAQRKAVSEANKKRVGVKYKTTNEHTCRCKCDVCLAIKNEKKRKLRAKNKLENPEHYREQQRKWDKNKNKDKTKIFILVPDVSIRE